MIQQLKSIFGIGPKANYKNLLAQGAVIIDVRTKEEFKSGHIKGSKNIPLNTITNSLNDKQKTYILCCASGIRSGSAKNTLKSKGFLNIYNAGSWKSLNNKLQ
ncbi:rhodanese-like domain-containing protein [uncultured Planktosalinus sp.]|uniref:rhodanese-like domain-containing protein n=1 Tax=uncultured Planktosalinus sp. TaxID=1810935 RepID=UPI0030D6FD76|tara:strand:- start:14 stop:322 length:309 start_codon:yes stop_codon:yes gene_type:complete